MAEISDRTLIIIALSLSIFLLAFNLWVIWKRREKYANQVVHAGAGGVAGPILNVDGYEQEPEGWNI